MERPRRMGAQSCIARFSPLRAPLAICVTEMFETDFAKVLKSIQSGPLPKPGQTPLSPNQAFARGKSKVANLSKSAKRRPLTRNRRVNVMIVDDVPDVTE